MFDGNLSWEIINDRRYKMKTTSDIYFAAALSALGAVLDDVDKSDSKHMKFTFTPRTAESFAAKETAAIATQDLDFIEKQWVNETLILNAVRYAEALKRLKSVVHSK
jgi:hypothetical protein